MDTLIEKVDGWGRYQKMVMALISSMATLVGLSTYITVFNNGRPKFTCFNKLNSDAILTTDVCEIYKNITQSSNGNSPYECSYDATHYGLTIVNEWSLICERIYLGNLTQTIFMLGAASSCFTGYISDRCGRKFVCIIMIFFISISLITCELLQLNYFNLDISVKYAVYCATQFILGFSTYCIYLTSYVLLVEITSASICNFVSIFDSYMYVFGEIVACTISYIFRDWHMHNMFIAIYSIIVLFLNAFMLPESPKFLATAGRFNEASKVMTKISKFNGKYKQDITEDDIIKAVTIAKEEEVKLTDDEITYKQEKQGLRSYLLNPTKNLFMTLQMSYIWISFGMIYFGIGYGITTIGSGFSPYITFLLSSFSEIVGYTICHFGKSTNIKKRIIAGLFIAAVCCCIVTLIPVTGDTYSLNSMLIIFFALFGKSTASAAFNLIYLYAAIIYPTHVRSTLVLYVACAGRAGSIIAPQINLLGILFWDRLPYIIFSANTFIACALVFLLPNADPAKYIAPKK